MKTTVKLIHRNDMRCETNLSGGAGILHVDSLKHKTQANCGPSPLDLLALAHGGCTAMLAAMQGAAEGVNVKDMEVEVEHEYDDGPPMRLKSARIRFVLAQTISSEQEGRLRAAAGTCPVHTALRPGISVTMEFVVRKEQ